MSDHDEAPDRDDALDRIAVTLGVSISSFFASEPSPPSGRTEAASDEEVAQALAVMRLFLQLKDPEARARCVTFIARELLHDP